MTAIYSIDMGAANFSSRVVWKSGWPESAILAALKIIVNFAEPSAPEPSPKQASRPSHHTNKRQDTASMRLFPMINRMG